MDTNVDPPKASDPKTASKPAANGRFEIPAHGGGGEKAGIVAGRPQPGRGGEAADPIRAQRDRRKEDQRASEIPQLFLGPHPVDDRSGGRAVGHRPALARFLHHPAVAAGQCHRRLLGRAPGGQRHRGAQGQAGDQGPGQAGWQMDHPAGAGTGAGRRHPPAIGRHRASRRALAGWRRGVRRSVRAHGRIVARHLQVRRRGLLRIDHPSRRDRRAGLCDGRENLFRQDRGTGADRGYRQPFSESRAADRQLPDHAGGGAWWR